MLRPPAVTFPGRRPPEGSGVCSPALEKTINARRKTGEEMTDSKRGQRGCADRDRSLKGTDHGDQPRPRTLDGREALSSPDPSQDERAMHTAPGQASSSLSPGSAELRLLRWLLPGAGPLSRDGMHQAGRRRQV